jgi:hypothetical protein
VAAARHGVLAAHLKPHHFAIGSINSPMQCMMKEICAQCLQPHVDPATGKWDALSGVNVTLGLPVIRTSVDHGTAFDIAGQGIASERSLIEAIDYAEALAARRTHA